MSKIQAVDLCVQFRNPLQGEAILALKDFNLTVEEGEFVALVGPSGCGKTTFLRVVNGLERAQSGYVDISRKDASRPQHAMVFQQAGLFPWMSVLENITYGMRVRGVGGRQRYQAGYQWMSRVGLERFADAFPHQLSGGMQQRVGLARAFAHNAEILLMDEPFAALDAQTRLMLQETTLNLWRDTDATVVFVTHSIEEALILGDRIVVMSARPGHVLTEFVNDLPRPRNPRALRNEARFNALYNDIWAVLGEQVKLTTEAQ